MPGTVYHAFTNAIPDSTDTQIVRPSDWNSQHLVSLAPSGAEMISGFSNANGISFGTNGAGAITASYTVPAGGGAVSFTATGNTVSDTTASGNSFVVSGGPNITAGFTGNTLFLSGGAGAAGNTGYLSAGTTNASLGTVSFADGSGVTFGVNGQTVTATVKTDYLTTAALSNHSHGFSAQGGSSAFQTLSFSNQNNVTFSNSNGQVVASASFPAQTVQTQGLVQALVVNTNSTGGGTATVNNSSLSLLNSNGITAFQTNGSQIALSVRADWASSNHSHGNPTLALTNLSGTTASASNGFTLSLSAGAGGAGDGVNILAAGTQTANTTGTVLFQDSNGITFGMSNNSRITATVKTNYALSDHSHGNPVLFLTNLSGTTNSASDGFTLSLSAATAAPSPVFVSAGTTGQSLATIQFNNGNKVSFGLDGSTITATVDLIRVGLSTAGNTSGDTGTIQGGQVVFAGINGITCSGSVNGVSQTISISGLSEAQLSYWDNMVPGQASGGFSSKAFQHNTLWIAPFKVVDRRWEANMTISTFNVLLSVNGSSATQSAAHTSNFSFGIYRLINNLSISLVDSVSTQIALAANASNSTAWQGIRWVTVHSSQWSSQPVLSAGETYYIGIIASSAGASNQTCNFMGQYAWATNVHSGTLGRSQSGLGTSQGFYPIIGHYSVTTGSFPDTIHQSQINKQVVSGNFIPFLLFNNRTGTI